MLQDKIHTYVRTCWDSDKDEVKRIIQEVIDENPDIKDHVKLGVIAKRRCIGEL